MNDLLGWAAAVATTIAAVMAASNVGARKTGGALLLFTMGAVAWCLEALINHLQSLMLSSLVLAFAGAVGVFRWFGHHARLQDGALAAAVKSRLGRAPLFPVSALEGSVIHGSDGFELAHIAGAMADCRTGRIRYIVVRSGGVGEGAQFRAIAWRDISCDETFRTRLTADELAVMPALDPADWPTEVPSRDRRVPDRLS